MKPLRVLLLVVLLLLVGGGGYFLSQWYKPHRSAANEKGVVLSVSQLVAAYTKNEHAADSLYLNKTLEVSGKVAEWGKNDAGQSTALLTTNDATADVYCTFKDSTASAATAGDSISVKGFCSGFADPDVKLTDCILKK